MILRATSFEIGIASMAEVALRRLRAMGIRDKPIAPTSPWQNGFAELGSIRRECVDHIAVWGEGALAPDLAGLCPLLQRHQNASVTGQNCARLSLCSTDRQLAAYPILGGLHHHYVRV